MRLSELQESCHRKVQQLQAVHREQLATAQAITADSLTAAAGPAATAVVAGDFGFPSKHCKTSKA